MSHDPRPSVLCLCCCAVLIGCTPLQDIVDWTTVDLMPPTFLGVQTSSADSVVVSFDEPVSVVEAAADLGTGVLPTTAEAAETVVTLFLPHPLPAGSEGTGMLVVADARGNLTNLSFSIAGFNGNLPGLLINELVVKGSSSHPDWTEILVTSDGNLAGVTVMDGTPWDWENRYVFPDVEVRAGDWLVIHWKPEGIPEEVTELESISASGGRDATDTARDFWVDPPGGLVGTNGVLAILENPGGALVDAVVYSNRDSDSDVDYRGFGSAKTLGRVEWISELGGWAGSQEGLRPEDAVWSGSTTATRSLARGSGSDDTNTQADWHTVPTSGATPGAVNTDETYGD